MNVTHDMVSGDPTAIGTAVANALGESSDAEKLVRFEYDVAQGGTNVTSAAYQQLVASTSRAYKGLEIFDSSGQPMILAVGPAASEVDIFYVLPGGNGKVKEPIPAGSRISVKAVETTADAGEIIINGLY